MNHLHYFKPIIFSLSVLSFLESCQKATPVINSNIKVVSHRGNWREHPENSILAISSSIKNGVDVVEIDIRETKDGELVLMHDERIDRTTNDTGFVKNKTLKELKSLFLKNMRGEITQQRIPTLTEVLKRFKDSTTFKLDKSFSFFDKTYAIVKEHGSFSRALFKCPGDIKETQKSIDLNNDSLQIFPLINLPDTRAFDKIKSFQPYKSIIGFEIIIPENETYTNTFQCVKKTNRQIWVNSIFERSSAKHDDNTANNDISTYNWYIENEINYIQTDRERLLLDFLGRTK